MEGDALALEHTTQFHRHVDGVAADSEVEVVGEEGVELNTKKAAFGKKSTVLLHDGEKMAWGIAIREHHRLATERTHFRAADVEYIAQAG